MPLTTKQQKALGDIQRGMNLSAEQWATQFGALTDEQKIFLADGVMARPEFQRNLDKFNADLAAKDLEVQQKKQELETQYTQEINRLGQLATTVQQTAGQDSHAVAAYRAKLNEIKTRYALDDAEVAVDVQTAQFNQQFQPQQPNPYQQPFQQQEPANPGFITQDELKRQIAEAQTANANMLAGTLKLNNEFIKEFNEPLDIDKVLGYASTHGVDVPTAINDVYDVQAKRQAKADAQRQTEIQAAVAAERVKWEQSRSTEGLFQADPNQAASVNAMKSVWNMKPVDAPVTTNGQVNVSDPARLADQTRRGAEVLARLNQP